METSETQTLLEVLAMAIFADKRVLAAEITAFSQAVQNLQAQNIINEALTETRVILWYETNKDRLKEILDNHEFEVWLQNIRGSLSDIQDPQPIIEAIKLIAEADEEYHVSENAYAILIQEKLAA